MKIAKIENENSTEKLVEQINAMKALSLSDQQKLSRLSTFNENTFKGKISYKLITEEKGYVYTFTKVLDIKNNDVANNPISFNLEEGNYKRANWPLVKNKNKKEDKPTINVSGSIQLPDSSKK